MGVIGDMEGHGQGRKAGIDSSAGGLGLDSESDRR